MFEIRDIEYKPYIHNKIRQADFLKNKITFEIMKKTKNITIL